MQVNAVARSPKFNYTFERLSLLLLLKYNLPQSLQLYNWSFLLRRKYDQHLEPSTILFEFGVAASPIYNLTMVRGPFWRLHDVR